jgi:ABC-2 type transport system permease protein
MQLNLSMHKIWLITVRDYVAAVQTKAFIAGMLIAPILCAANFLVVAWKTRSDIADKRIAIVDRTGVAGTAVIDSLRKQNERELRDKATGVQIIPRYQFENIPPETNDPVSQRVALSDRVRRQELFAFVEIGANAFDPSRNASGGAADDSIYWYAVERDAGSADRFVAGAINDGLRQVRLNRIGLASNQSEDLLGPLPLQRMSLVSKEEKTGQAGEARKKGDLDILFPATVVIILVLTVMFTSAPMLSAIAEDKMQRVFEMLLVSATPFELITGKVLAAVARSLTSAALYIVTAIVLIWGGVMSNFLPISVLPWFLIYLIAAVTMVCALSSALGAACGSPQDASSFAFLLVFPLMLPTFLMFPIIGQPNSGFAVAMSMIPPFTPTLMLARQLSPEGIPTWQPVVGLIGVLVTTLFISWLASRIFRIGILLQGKTPKLSDLIRWGIKG